MIWAEVDLVDCMDLSEVDSNLEQNENLDHYVRLIELVEIVYLATSVVYDLNNIEC